MTRNVPPEESYARLRRQAEKILKGRGENTEPDNELLRAVYELEVHQIELDLQNEELRKASKELESARDEYASLYESAPVGFLIVGKDGVVRRANRAAMEMLGYSLATVLGIKLAMIVDARDLEAYSAAINRIAGARAKNTQADLELRFLTNRGNILPTRVVAAPGYDEGGIFSHWLLVLIDITRRKKAEEELKKNERLFRALTEKTSEFIVLLDSSFKISYTVTGHASRLLYGANDLLGRDALELVHLDDRPVAAERLRQILRRPNELQRMELRIRAKKGGWLWMIVSGKNLLNDPAVRGIVINGRDITERKRIENELKRSRDDLEQRVRERTIELSHAVGSLRERTKQLGNLTAELIRAEQNERQRLARILHDGLQQMLVGAIFQIDIFERDRKLPDELLRLKEILNQASETSRLLAMELSPPILLRGDLCAALRWLAGWMGKTHGLTVELATPEELPDLVNEAFLMLFQSARELLFNVAKHAGVRKACVELDRQDGWVRLTVKDEGKGFTANGLRLEGGKIGGFGLFSMRERLSLMGGRLEIDSAPGRGSQVRLIFPLSHVTKRGAGTSLEEQTAIAGAKLPGEEPRLAEREMKIRIMLVDDHEVVRQGVANLIRREPDFEIVGEASEGKSAVDLVREVRPDVVLMDINMPVMNGIEATRLIHNEFPDIRIIGFSIYDEEQQKEAMLQAGAAAYFCKRGSSKDLIGAIRACL